MKIKSIKLTNFKRFTDLSIEGLTENLKLVVLVGPNGSGKTSLFESFNHWQKYRGWGNPGQADYCVKDIRTVDSENWWLHNVDINFYDFTLQKPESARGVFYFRTAYRNEASLRTDSLQKQKDYKEVFRFDTLIQNDSSVSSNYQRLVSMTLKNVYNSEYDEKTVKALREELTGKIRKSLNNLFEDLDFSNIGNPLQNGGFYFTKGVSKDFSYKNLSAGEKSAFDLILDLIMASTSFEDAVFCIDEPEAHMHTSLQSKLLDEMYQIIPEKSQLWIATHSMGMLKKAKELSEKNPGTVAFIDFSDKDFDAPVVMHPSSITSAIWHKFLEIAMGDFSDLIAPKQVVFCEGSTQKRFDDVVYKKIFDNEFPETEFVSIGSCTEIEDSNNTSIRIVMNLLNGRNIIKLVDKDDRSENDITELKAKGINVLSRRHIECYLLDNEIIEKLCAREGKVDLLNQCLEAKETAIKDSISRGNPTDDVKSAAGAIYNALKRILQLTGCGKDQRSFMRDTMAPLITEETEVYKTLKKDIFE